jgi:hypothetical protein
MANTRQMLQAALERALVDKRGKPVELRLLPGLSMEEVEGFARSLPVAPPDDFCDLLSFCAGFEVGGEGPVAEVRFNGIPEYTGPGDFLVPRGVVIAHDWCGNLWIVDLCADGSDWGPIYYCCHDPAVMLVQAATVSQFVEEMLKLWVPPHESLIEEVHEDRLFQVWSKNPGVISREEALRSHNTEIRASAAELEGNCGVVDLRGAPVGMGFSWGRYGAATDVQRYGALPIFAYQKPQKRGIVGRLFGGGK